MRFLADENLASITVEALRRLGHDVAWIRTDAPGSTDEQVLARAAAERRVLLTADKDFGELALPSGASCRERHHPVARARLSRDPNGDAPLRHRDSR